MPRSWAVLALLLVSTADHSRASDEPLLWQPRGTVVFTHGVAPAPPFRFRSEDSSGRSPKVTVRDARGTEWSVKFGPEVRSETFSARLAWALGYYSDATWFMPRGTIRGAANLQRAAEHIAADGSFRDARFERREPSCRLLTEKSWKWSANPFTGSRELNGLKLLAMLVSNWDHKDAGDDDSNNSVLECRSGARPRLIYYVSDWGGSMGKWGRKFFHNKWDCEAFGEQTADFVGSVEGGKVRFGFSSGRGSEEIKDNISVEDVRWFVARLSSVTRGNLRQQLLASGASAHEADHFSSALWNRIGALRAVAGRERPR